MRPLMLVAGLSTLAAAGVTQAAPPNDDCSSATVVTGVPNGFTGFFEAFSVSDATTEPTDPVQTCSGPSANSHSVWYTYTPPFDGRIGVNTNTADYDTVISVYTGTCGALTEIACNDDIFGRQTSAVIPRVTAGTTYLVEITGAGTSSGQLGMGLIAQPDSPVCGETSSGASEKARLKISGLHRPLGEQALRFRWNLSLAHIGEIVDPLTNGAQVLVEDVLNGWAPLFSLALPDAAIP